MFTGSGVVLFLNYLLKLSYEFWKSKTWDFGFEVIPRNLGTSYRKNCWRDHLVLGFRLVVRSSALLNCKQGSFHACNLDSFSGEPRDQLFAYTWIPWRRLITKWLWKLDSSTLTPKGVLPSRSAIVRQFEATSFFMNIGLIWKLKLLDMWEIFSQSRKFDIR